MNEQCSIDTCQLRNSSRQFICRIIFSNFVTYQTAKSLHYDLELTRVILQCGGMASIRAVQCPKLSELHIPDCNLLTELHLEQCPRPLMLSLSCASSLAAVRMTDVSLYDVSATACYQFEHVAIESKSAINMLEFPYCHQLKSVTVMAPLYKYAKKLVLERRKFPRPRSDF